MAHDIEHDGRTLHVRDDGDPDGFPVFGHHGTPGAARPYPKHIEEARERGVRLLGVDRAGYGGSTRAPGRTVADVAGDIAAVADALGIERFATFGGSGGGPHALACAALLPDRVTAAVSIAGVAPFEAKGLNWLAGMGQDNLVEFGATLMGEERLTELLESMAAGMTEADPEHVLDEIASLVGPADQASLTTEGLEHMSASTREALAPGVGGWYDDDIAMFAPWGFDLASITVPTLVLHGRDDRFVPVAHAEWLAAAIPAADVQISARDGHLSIAEDIGPVLDWILSRTEG